MILKICSQTKCGLGHLHVKIFQHYGGDDRTCTKRGLKEALDAPAPSLENVTQRSSRQFETQDWGGGGGKLLETLIVSENYV